MSDYQVLLVHRHDGLLNPLERKAARKALKGSTKKSRKEWGTKDVKQKLFRSCENCPYNNIIRAMFNLSNKADGIDKKARELKTCGGCKMVYYCSMECQTKHWKSCHKKECKKLRRQWTSN